MDIDEIRNFKKLLLLTINGVPFGEIEDGQDRSKIIGECHQCVHKRNVPYNSHIKCVKPDADMTGDKHGIEKGWFMYPMLFDPTWKTKQCANFEQQDAVSHAISDAVSNVE